MARPKDDGDKLRGNRQERRNLISGLSEYNADDPEDISEVTVPDLTLPLPIPPHVHPNHGFILGILDRIPPNARVWVVLAVLGAAWWLVALLWGNDPAHPTLSLLLDPALETYPGRVLGYAVWLAAGRWLATR